MITNAKILEIGANPGKYHTKHERCTIGASMSSTSIKAFALCPSKYKAGVKDEPTSAKDFGSLVDCLALTPAQQVGERFAIQASTYTNEKGETKKWSNNSNTCKAWTLEQIKAGKIVITQEELSDAATAVLRLANDATIASFIKQSDTQVWLSAQWHDEQSGLSVPLRSLIDLVPKSDSEFGLCIGDLKTTRNAALSQWTRDVFNFCYHVQAAFNLDMYNAASKEDRTTFCHIIQENTPPFEPGKRMLDAEFIEMGRIEYRAALANYCKCLEFGVWPGYDQTDEASQGWTNCAPEPWMMTKGMFDPKYIFEPPT
jgi:hypothetical protein